MGRVDFLTRLVPPQPVLVMAARFVVPLIVATVVLAALQLPGVALAFALGAIAGIPGATSALPASTRFCAAAVFVVAAVGGAMTSASPLLCAALVTALALAQAPLTRRAAGLGMFAPVVCAVLATGVVSPPGGATALFFLGLGAEVGAGFASAVLLAHVLRLSRAATTIDRQVAIRHAVAYAVLAGPAVYLTRSLDVAHGYWLVLVLAAVLHPSPRDIRGAVRRRWIGTSLGVLIAIAVAALLPWPVLIAAAVVTALMAAGWALARRDELQALYGTVTVVLIGSSGMLATGVGIGVERLALTGAATVVALGAAAILARLDDRVN